MVSPPIDASRQAPNPSGIPWSASNAVGSGQTRAGSLGMSAVGISSRTWWKAQRLNGAVRQFASVTCPSGGGGNPCMSGVIG